MRSTRALSPCLLAFLVAGLWVAGGPEVAVGLEVGEQAPDFTLPSTNGEKISLSQFRGKKLLLLEFYGGAFVPT